MSSLNRCILRTQVMENLDLTPNARILFYIIDDKAGSSPIGAMWWHWKKIAFTVGVDKGRFFELIGELKAAGVITQRREGRKVFYIPISVQKIALSQKTHTIEPTAETQSEKSDRSVRKIGLKRDPSIYEPVFESEPLIPFGENKTQNPGACPECFGAGYVLVPRVTRGQSHNERRVCRCARVEQRA